MKAHTASAINAVILIAVSLWGFLASGMASYTALLPAAFGVGLLACYPGIKTENKVIAHVAAVLTVIVLVALIMPLRGAFGRGDDIALARIGIMWLSTAFAMVFLVKSFIDARRRRSNN